MPRVLLCFSTHRFAHPLRMGLDCALAPESWLMWSLPASAPREQPALVGPGEGPAALTQGQAGDQGAGVVSLIARWPATESWRRLPSAPVGPLQAMSWYCPCGVGEVRGAGAVIMEESAICSHPLTLLLNS